MVPKDLLHINDSDMVGICQLSNSVVQIASQ